jgi:hypothetical protein
MRDTGGKHIINTFRYKHHAILIPKITITDCILNATCCLTAAIEGIQEAAPDELQAIKSLCQILLANTPPNNHSHHLLHLSLMLTSMKNQPICGIQLVAHTTPCPQHPIHQHLKQGMPSLAMKTKPHLALLTCHWRIPADQPLYRKTMMHHPLPVTHKFMLNYKPERKPISSIW